MTSGVPLRVEIHIREFLGVPRVNTLWAGDSRGITLTSSELETVTVFYRDFVVRLLVAVLNTIHLTEAPWEALFFRRHMRRRRRK